LDSFYKDKGYTPSPSDFTPSSTTSSTSFQQPIPISSSSGRRKKKKKKRRGDKGGYEQLEMEEEN